MSYRNYKIIDDKSGLIVPQALMDVGAKISAAFSAELSRQFKETQALNKDIAQKGYNINTATQKRIDALDEKAMDGPTKLINSFKTTQKGLIRRSGDLATEIMQAETRGKGSEEVNALKEERSKVQSSIGQMNTSFIKMGVIGQTTSELNTAGNSKLGVTEIYTNSDQMIEAQAITGAPDTSALYGLDENYNPVIKLSGQKVNWEEGSKSPYEKSISLGAFNDDKYSPITSIPNMYKATFDKTNTIVDGGKGRIGKAFLENETFTTENKIVDGKIAGRGERGIQAITPDGQAALNVALDEIMTNIASTKGKPGQTNAVLKNQFYIPKEKIEAYQNIDNPAHKEAVDFVKFSAAKQVASQYGLEPEMKIDDQDNATFNFYKKGSFKEYAAKTSGAKADKKQINFATANTEFKKAIEAGGEERPSFRNLLTNVGSIVESGDIYIDGKKTIRNVSAFGNSGLTVSWGKPDYSDTATGATIKAAEFVRAGKPMQIVTIDGDDFFAKDVAAKDANSISVDLNNRSQAIGFMENILRVERNQAIKLYDTYYK